MSSPTGTGGASATARAQERMVGMRSSVAAGRGSCQCRSAVSLMAAVSRQSIGSVLRARIQLAVRVPRGRLAASAVSVMAASKANRRAR